MLPPLCPENQLMMGPHTSHQSSRLTTSLWFFLYDVTRERTALSWHQKSKDCSVVTSEVKGTLLRCHRSPRCLQANIFLIQIKPVQQNLRISWFKVYHLKVMDKRGVWVSKRARETVWPHLERYSIKVLPVDICQTAGEIPAQTPVMQSEQMTSSVGQFRYAVYIVASFKLTRY